MQTDKKITICVKDRTVEEQPFKHFLCRQVIGNGGERDLFNWLEAFNDWSLTTESFYTQYECSLLPIELPESLGFIKAAGTIDAIIGSLQEIYRTRLLRLVDITAHKLVTGHKMGVHNDFIEGEETHRFLIQINPYWTETSGGYLMLCRSSEPEDVQKLVKPLNNTGFGFEISRKSFHAVSTVHEQPRYTVVFSFTESVQP